MCAHIYYSENRKRFTSKICSFSLKVFVGRGKKKVGLKLEKGCFSFKVVVSIVARPPLSLPANRLSATTKKMFYDLYQKKLLAMLACK